MTRTSLCWLVSLLALSMSAVQADSPRPQDNAPADSRPEPRVYHFDISSAEEFPEHPAGTDDAEHSGRISQHEPATRDTHVRAATVIRSIQPAPIAVSPQEVLIDGAQPRPLYAPEPGEGADTLPPPMDHVLPLWGPLPGPGFELGGIPTFTHTYCPSYWGDPWRDYCHERWWWHCGRVHQTAAELGEVQTSCCRACGGTSGEAPMPARAELPAIVPDGVPDNGDTPDGRPTKRRLPRNDLPEQQ